MTELVLQVSSLEELAHLVQGEDVAAGESAVPQLVQNYDTWYTRALGLLPPDLRDGFRFEYEGRPTGFRYRIKQFLQDPRKPSIAYDPNHPRPEKQILGPWTHPVKERFIGPLRQQKLILQEAIERFGVNSVTLEALDLLEQISRKLKLSLALLQRAYWNDRAGFTVADEYDLQHFLHSILILHFPEVEFEEPTPKSAGASSRLDFLLPLERTAIETKMMRKSLSMQKLRTELASDILHFRSHAEVEALFVCVYDPECKIANAAGFERQLSTDSGEFPVRVVVAQ